MKELVGLLMEIVKSNASDKARISKFQNMVFDADPDLFENEEQERIFGDLAYDLEHCFSSNGILDSEKAMREIRSALEELKNL